MARHKNYSTITSIIVEATVKADNKARASNRLMKTLGFELDQIRDRLIDVEATHIAIIKVEEKES